MGHDSRTIKKDLGGGVTASVTGAFSNLSSGMAHISGAYSAGLSDVGAGEMRKAGVVLDKMTAAGYTEEMSATVCRALFGDQSEENMREAYKFFDADGNGFIDPEEMKRALPLMGEDVPEERVEELFQMVNKNR